MTALMRAWRSPEETGLAALEIVQIPVPGPGDNELLVRVDAAALNFSDLLMIDGMYQIRPDRPFTPGQEIAGTVVAAGGASAAANSKSKKKAATYRASRNSGRWGVQVGAYLRYASAYDAARKAVNRLPSVLGDGSIKIMPFRKKTKTTIFYRGRVIGIEKSQAVRACRLLKRQNIPCMQVRVTASELAAAR